MAKVHSAMSIEATQEIFHVDAALVHENFIGKDELLEQLNEASVAAINSMLRFRQHYFFGQKFKITHITDSFMHYSNDEQEHADWLANRMVQLGGTPDFSLSSIMNTTNQTYAADDSLFEMLTENLVASRATVTNYRDLIKYHCKEDPATSVILNIILLDKEKHAEALEKFIESVSTQH